MFWRMYVCTTPVLTGHVLFLFCLLLFHFFFFINLKGDDVFLFCFILFCFVAFVSVCSVHEIKMYCACSGR